MAMSILADANIQGHVERLVDLGESGPWAEFWAELGRRHTTFRSLGLDPNASDREIWRLCQTHQLVLLMANRNHDDPDSLEAVIREENTPTSLPVFTIGDADHIWESGDYAERVIVKLLDYLLELDAYRGTGRLFLP